MRGEEEAKERAHYAPFRPPPCWRPTLTAGLPTLAALKLLEPTQLPGAGAHPAPLLAAWELRSDHRAASRL